MLLCVAAIACGAEGAQDLLAGLVVILVLAQLGGELFERIHLPSVLGELLGGIVLGNLPHVGFDRLAFVTADPTIAVLAELGVVLLLFEVGLESDVTQMLRVGASSFLVATAGVIAPMALGWLSARVLLPDVGWHSHVFIGAILCATSVGITARVLRDMGKIQSVEGRIVLGAAVIDDVMGLVVLAVVQGIIAGDASGRGLGVVGVAIIVAKAVGFLAGAMIVGGRLSFIVFRVANRFQLSGLLLTMSLAFCFAFAWLAWRLGLAPIVGAFAAGLVLDEVAYQPLAEKEKRGLEELVRPVASLLVPVFFVMTGAHVDLRVFGSAHTVGFAAVLTLAAVIGKQACAWAAIGRNLNRAAIGIGMIPRGEVGLIFASVGASMMLPDGTPVVDTQTFGAVVIMVMATTLITPPMLAWAFRRAG